MHIHFNKIKCPLVEGARRVPGVKTEFQKMLILVLEVKVQSPKVFFEILKKHCGVQPNYSFSRILAHCAIVKKEVFSHLAY